MPCRYPEVQHKPGPKLGSHSSKHRKRICWRLEDRSPSRQEDVREAEDSNSIRRNRGHQRQNLVLYGDNNSTASDASSPESTTAQSWVFHHFHEDQSYSISQFTACDHANPSETLAAYAWPSQDNTGYVCRTLGVSKEVLFTLTRTYFEKVPFLSLFHRPTFDAMVYNKIQQGPSSALLAAVCTIAAHYMEDRPDPSHAATHTPHHFYKLACTITTELLDKCGDGKPPLALLQALILIAYYEMIVSARGRAWRSLGTCVRVAHEIELHLTDSTLQGKSLQEQKALTEAWSRKEEQRRAWWLLWELDVFASTVRRRPASIHDGEHAVLLPVSERAWLEGHYQPSCFLDPDPLHRTRKLRECGNSNGNAWFIVINSLVRDAHTTANPTSHCDRGLPRTDVSPLVDTASGNSVDERRLAVLDDFILYFKTMMPKECAYQGDYLSFSISGDSYSAPTAKEDCEKQLVHAMTHLGRLMILHHYCIRNSGPSVLRGKKLLEYLSLSGPSVTQKLRAILGFSDDQSAWERYLGAAEEIMRVVRNASPNHIRYGHPLLACTFWIVAATQLFKKAFAQDEAERELAQSNFDLLRLTLDHSHKFWKTSELMVKNIDTLGSRLGELSARLAESQGGGSDALGCLNEVDYASVGTNAFDDLNDMLPGKAGQNDNTSAAATKTALENMPMSNGVDYIQASASQIPFDTALSADKPTESELQAFMYDFCGDNWDFWGQDLADLFPSGCPPT
ncbi:hypothetical protein AYL99_00888 [Fonsecaea erecta]|uniref:Xylanolytic transcriptional activator regulatory domain-containing protein n=1 Tax=Fonsecaea erecta TaxID=1367422 RepID=A0A178ZZY1_9EURO|nr:hypothetical protein AYL99_00888 [Fonsecaea erecta]OAP64916.1 hypothetical protein AYL99_00888 [Fonsecaea erecta]